jgi:hypothetical protein
VSWPFTAMTMSPDTMRDLHVAMDTETERNDGDGDDDGTAQRQKHVKDVNNNFSKPEAHT